MVVKIERAALDLYGQDQFDADVFTFKKLLKEHAETEGQAAPTAHPFVEQVVRDGGGKYLVIEPPVIEEPATVEPTLEDEQERAFETLRQFRVDAANSGVMLNGVKFSSKSENLTALLAAKFEADDNDIRWSTRWRVGPGQYVKVTKTDIDFLIGAIRAKHAKAFDHERELSEQIVSAISVKALANIDLTKGWE